MKLFLMRHGEAEHLNQSDASRQLTHRGRNEVSGILTDNKNELLAVDCIWHSPYVRALQTAEIAAEILQKPLMTVQGIIPSGDPRKVVESLQNTKQTLLLVSHQPLVGTLLDSLAGLEIGRHRMGTAALACIETEVFAKDCGELCWLHQPEFA